MWRTKNENEIENEKKTQKECKKAEKRREKEVAFMEQNKLTHVQIWMLWIWLEFPITIKTGAMWDLVHS